MTLSETLQFTAKQGTMVCIYHFWAPWVGAHNWHITVHTRIAEPLKVVSPTYFGPHGRQLPSATAAVATAVRQQGGIAQAARWLSSLLDRGCEPHRGSKSLRLLRGRALWAGAAWLQALVVATRSSCTSTEAAVSGWRLHMGQVRHQRRCCRCLQLQHVLIWRTSRISSRRRLHWP